MVYCIPNGACTPQNAPGLRTIAAGGTCSSFTVTNEQVYPCEASAVAAGYSGAATGNTITYTR